VTATSKAQPLNVCHDGDCREILDQIRGSGLQVQCVVTSPPYWGLRRYLPEAHPDSHLELGQEALHDCVGWATGAPCGHCYVCHLVAVLRGVREVLADDGVVWLNLGDTYVSGGGSKITPQTGSEFADRQRGREVICRSPRKLRSSGCDLAPKNLVGIPWRVALALQADGWILRQDVIWGKVAPMPESVQDRCTKSHEYVFLLAKQQDYFFDAAAISEPATGKLPGNIKHKYVDQAQVLAQHDDQHLRTKQGLLNIGARQTRNRRSVWSIPYQPFAGAHFATFPKRLAELCILAGTSSAGHCPECGRRAAPDGATPCGCKAEPVPDIVLDPFFGSGTTGQAAQDLGRSWMGIELNPNYALLQSERTRQSALAL